MKRITIALLIGIMPMLMFAQTEKGSWSCHQKKVNSSFSPTLKTNNAPIHSFDVLHYNLDLDIYNCYLSPYPSSFTASNTMTFRADSVINFIQLDAVNSSLIIDSISPSTYTFTHQNDILQINFNETINAGVTKTLKIYYRHTNLVNDGAFYVTSGRLFTDCEPEGARKWFPCWDKPADKATMELRTKVPSNVLLGSNGRLQDSLKIADTIWYHWASRDPVATYLMTITSNVDFRLDIVYWHPNGSATDSVPIRFYYKQGESVNNIKNKIIPVTDYFSDIYGMHPFEKNGFASIDTLFTWGGMENQTLTSLCKNCWSEMLAVHEYAHQWFGDMITCATWGDIWINEGFATYSEALWIEHSQNYGAYKSDLIGNAQTYFNQNPGWAISEPSWSTSTPDVNTLFNYAITYMKGSCVLHMLRYVVGETDFFTILHNYAGDASNKYKNATIGDFFNKVQDVTGLDYSWFKEQWIHQPNHPTYLINTQLSNIQGPDYNVDVIVNQTQTNTAFFKMPIEFRIQFSDLSDTIVKVWNTENNQTFQFTFNKQPTSFEFDPFRNILLKTAQTTVGVDALTSFQIKELNVFPNPSNGIFDISFFNPKNGNVDMKITDLTGKVIYSDNSFYKQGYCKKQLSEESLNKGMYLLILENGSSNSTVKFVVQ